MGITIVSKSGVETKYIVKNNLVEKLAIMDRREKIREEIRKEEASKKYLEEGRKQAARNAKIETAKKEWWDSLSDREKEIQETRRWMSDISQRMWRSRGQDFCKTGNGIVSPKYRELYNTYLESVKEIEEYEKTHTLTPPTWIHLLQT